VQSPFLAGHMVGSLCPEELAALDAIGAALFAGRPMRVGYKGLVHPKPTFVTQAEKDSQNGQSEGSRRSEPGSRQRRQGSRRQGSSWPRPRHSDSSELLRWAVGDCEQVDALRRKYPSAKITSDPVGTWLAVRTAPIGATGPQALLLIAVPSSSARVEAWAFWTKKSETIWIGPRHTNLPNGSICAFPLKSDCLDCEWPLRLYVDLLSEWCARHLYLAIYEKWPGPQEGLWVGYRLRETRPGECCPRCANLNLYEACCKSQDQRKLLDTCHPPEPEPDFSGRTPPNRVLELARRAGRNPPRMLSILS
jgi:hypothetical protein